MALFRKTSDPIEDTRRGIATWQDQCERVRQRRISYVNELAAAAEGQAITLDADLSDEEVVNRRERLARAEDNARVQLAACDRDIAAIDLKIAELTEKLDKMTTEVDKEKAATDVESKSAAVASASTKFASATSELLPALDALIATLPHAAPDFGPRMHQLLAVDLPMALEQLLVDARQRAAMLRSGAAQLHRTPVPQDPAPPMDDVGTNLSSTVEQSFAPPRGDRTWHGPAALPAGFTERIGKPRQLSDSVDRY